MGNKNQREGPPDFDSDSVLKLVDLVLKDVKDLNKLVRDGGNGFPPLIARALVNEKAIEALTKRQNELESATRKAIGSLETHSQEQHGQIATLLERRKEETQLKTALGPAKLHSRASLRNLLIQSGVSLIIAVITLVSYHYFWSNEEAVHHPETQAHYTQPLSERAHNTFDKYFGSQSDIDNYRVNSDLNQLSKDLKKREQDRAKEHQQEMAKHKASSTRTSSNGGHGGSNMQA